MNVEPKRGPLCRCCESAASKLGDPNARLVCADCYAGLTLARATLEKIGPIIGVGACSNEVDR
jgi:hypothetical protein